MNSDTTITLPACCLCGKPFSGPDTEDSLERLKALKESSPGLYRVLHSMVYGCVACDECLSKSDEERRRERIYTLTKKTYESGLLPRDAVGHRFGNVRPSWRSYNPAAWDKAIAWRFQPKGLYISGDPGRGKTFMARCILNRMLDEGHSVMEVFIPELAQRICEQDYRKTVDNMASVKVLLVDDIDKATWRDYCLVAFFGVIDARWRQKLPTIVTANYTGKALRTKWMEQYEQEKSIAGSLIDRLNCEGVQLTGPSIRMLMNQEFHNNEEGEDE